MKYLLVCLLACVFSCTYLSEPLADQDFINNIHETPDYVSITSEGRDSFATGLFFYPGALVDPYAYVGWLDRLVSMNPDLLVVVVKMPANLAVFNPDKALGLRDELPHAARWLISGHSLGGTMACKSADNNRNAYQAVILLAAYADEMDNLSNWSGPVLSISAELDGLSTPADLQAGEPLLPTPYYMTSTFDFPMMLQAKTSYFEIAGGNHAQFGNYGKQNGDGQATINAEQQQATVITIVTQFIDLL